MTFDIHQKVFNQYGELLEKKAGQYQDQLLQLYGESPEGLAIQEEGISPGHWASIFIEFGVNYVGIIPPQMSPADLREILFEIIPRKLSTVPEAAPEIIRDLQFFWRFLQREFQLENAAACLKVLDDKKATHKLEQELGNPANFGIAKSFVMMGLERGFDMSTEEGVNEWMEIYNNELASGAGQRIPLPSPFGGMFDEFSVSPRKAKDKTKRRMSRKSRKRNRK